jgi:hypothetical protein
MTGISPTVHAILCLASALAGFADIELGTTARPLSPLVYTEMPDRSSAAVAVEERRLLRELVEGAISRDESLSDHAPLRQVFQDAPALGRAIVQALVEGNETTWDHVFIDAVTYSRVVGVSAGRAREFVNQTQADSDGIWSSFHAPGNLRAKSGETTTSLRFDSLELGKPRDLAGAICQDPDAAQYWGNTLRLRADDGVLLDMRIAKILRIPTRPHRGAVRTEQSLFEFRVAAPIDAGRHLNTYLNAGMHLGQDAIDRFDTQFPLEIGNYWRYGIRGPDRPTSTWFANTSSGSFARSTEALLKVVSVERYGPLHLVQLHREYDDADLTRVRLWWVVTARRVDLCDRACRRNVSKTEWMLDYLARHEPIVRFGSRRGEESSSRPSKEKGFTSSHHPMINVPAGLFPSARAIRGRGRLGLFDRNTAFDQTRYFVPGTGIVKEEIFTSAGEVWTLDLIDYRLMPRH